MLTDIEKLIMELKEEKEALEKRLNYLLRSKTIQLFDETDPVTGEHLRQISRLDTYGVHRKLLEFEKSNGVGYGLPGHEPPETIQARQIKTIIYRLDASDDFDKEVNQALREGWSLVRRGYQRPLSQPSMATFYTMLYAELEKVVTFPVIEVNTK